MALIFPVHTQPSLDIMEPVHIQLVVQGIHLYDSPIRLNPLGHFAGRHPRPANVGGRTADSATVMANRPAISSHRSAANDKKALGAPQSRNHP